ncbi:hypothetical protein D8770_08280 [Methylobacterium sp. DB1607]|nr:hypothetical protein [Methylobacterium sp. DB1607]
MGCRRDDPPPSAGEGASRMRGGRGAGTGLSGSGAPLTRPPSGATLSRRGERAYCLRYFANAA